MSKESFARITSPEAVERRKRDPYTLAKREAYLRDRRQKVLLVQYAPELTDDEKKQQEEYIILHHLPF